MCLNSIDDKPALTRGYKVLHRTRCRVLRGEFYSAYSGDRRYIPGTWYTARKSYSHTLPGLTGRIRRVAGFHVFDSLFDAAVWHDGRADLEIWEVATRPVKEEQVSHGTQHKLMLVGGYSLKETELSITVARQMKLIRRVA